MDKLLAVVQYILNMGPTVILPITIVVLGMIFRIKFTKALKSGLTIGIGFVGINLVVNLLTSTLGPAAQGYMELLALYSSRCSWIYSNRKLCLGYILCNTNGVISTVYCRKDSKKCSGVL